jgi:hypothetical protein
MKNRPFSKGDRVVVTSEMWPEWSGIGTVTAIGYTGTEVMVKLDHIPNVGGFPIREVRHVYFEGVTLDD